MDGWRDGNTKNKRVRERVAEDRREKKRTMRETEGQVVDIKNRQNTTISLSCRHVEVMQRFLKST